MAIAAANLFGCNAMIAFRQQHQHPLFHHNNAIRDQTYFNGPCRTTASTTTTTFLSAVKLSPPTSHLSSFFFNNNSTNILTNSKLIYFPLPGRGEAIRLALTISNISFTDHRIPFRSWGSEKTTTIWGTLPILELSSDDGSTTTCTRLGQSRSILRFVGKHTGLYPTTTSIDGVDAYLYAQRIDELMDALEDLGTAVGGVGVGLEKEDLEVTRKLDATKENGVVYGMLHKIDTFIAEMGNNNYAVGNSLTIADLLTFTSMGRLAGGVYFGIPATVCDPFENIQNVRRKVGQDQRVREWYDERKRVGKLSPAEQVLSNCRDM